MVDCVLFVLICVDPFSRASLGSNKNDKISIFIEDLSRNFVLGP